MKKNDIVNRLLGILSEEDESDALAQQIRDNDKHTMDHLKSMEKYNEYDCVAFGLEADDGSIVKVYVKAEDSEKFEESLGNLLGECDDIEEALNKLAAEYEIVDVEWPTDTEESESVSDPALNADVYKNKVEAEVTEGQLFLDKLNLDESVSFIMLNSRISKEVAFLLGEFGLNLNSEMFLTATKKIHNHAIKNLSDEEKNSIFQFAHRIRTINSNKAVPVSDSDNKEQVKEEYDFESKFKSKVEHMIFNIVKYLILGNDEQNLSAFVKPQMYAEFVQIIKTSKFKQIAYRQAIKNFMHKINLAESVEGELIVEQGDAVSDAFDDGRDKKPAKAPEKKISKDKPAKEIKKPDENEKTDESSGLEKLSYKDLAKRDKNIKLAVDVLEWLGFSKDVLDSAVLKMELRQQVRATIKRRMTTSEAKRVKMLWSYSVDEKISESKWTDESEENIDTKKMKSSEIIDAFDLPDSIKYKPWKFTKLDDAIEFKTKEDLITFSEIQFDKIVKALKTEKKAFVALDSEEQKWVFTSNESGGIFIVKKGTTDKLFMSPSDIDNMFK
jgi:hypothetical protein